MATSVAFAALLAASRSGAQTPSESELVAHGIQLRQQGNDDQALAEFERAYQISHGARARAQMALAEQALGRWALAEAHLNEAMAAHDPWIEQNRAVLRGSLDLIGRHLGSLDVRANAPNAEVWIHGERVGTVPLAAPLRVETGTTEIEVRAEGYGTVRRTVDITRGVLSRESFVLTRRAVDEPVEHPVEHPVEQPVEHPVEHPVVVAPQPVAVTQSPAVEPSPGGSNVPYVIMAVGAASLIGAGVFYALRASAIGDCTQLADTLYCPTQTSVDRANQGPTYTAVGNVLLVSGAIELAGGAIFWLLTRGHASSEHARTRFHLLPIAGGVHFGLGGTF